MRFPILFAILFALAAPALAQQALPPSPWSVDGDRLRFAAAQLSVPARVGTAEHYESKDFSGERPGLNSAVLYRTPDQEVFATVYVYLPSVADPALHLIATDDAIRVNSSGSVRELGFGTAAAGGVAGGALTAAYDNYLGRLHSRAAFIKLGRWLVKLRVSGPQARAAEVAAVAEGLLSGLRFEGELRPRPARAFEMARCGKAATGKASLLKDGGHDFLAALSATFDASEPEPEAATGATQPNDLGRIGTRWCRDDLELQGKNVPMLRAADAPTDVLGRSALFVLYSDAGGILELLQLPGEKKFVLLNHGIGEVAVLGSYDSVPGRAQMESLFRESGDAVRPRALVRINPDGNSEITLPSPEPGKPN